MRAIDLSRTTAVKLLAMAVAAACLACGHDTPEQKLIQKAQPVGSWLAALQMAGEKWSANSVPDAFVRDSVAAARQSFSAAARETAKSDARAELRDRLRQLAAASRAAGARLRHAVEAGDRPAALAESRRLAALHGEFLAIKAAAKPEAPR